MYVQHRTFTCIKLPTESHSYFIGALPCRRVRTLRCPPGAHDWLAEFGSENPEPRALCPARERANKGSSFYRIPGARTVDFPIDTASLTTNNINTIISRVHLIRVTSISVLFTDRCRIIDRLSLERLGSREGANEISATARHAQNHWHSAGQTVAMKVF